MAAIEEEVVEAAGISNPERSGPDEVTFYAKWYDWRKDMRALSERFPTIYFSLEGLGDDRDDMWCAFFLNDACQVNRAAIAWPSAPTREDLAPREETPAVETQRGGGDRG
jgi:hypothetical protein